MVAYPFFMRLTNSRLKRSLWKRHRRPVRCKAWLGKATLRNRFEKHRTTSDKIGVHFVTLQQARANQGIAFQTQDTHPARIAIPDYLSIVVGEDPMTGISECHFTRRALLQR